LAARLGVEPSPFASEAAVLETARAAAHLRAMFILYINNIKKNIVRQPNYIVIFNRTIIIYYPISGKTKIDARMASRTKKSEVSKSFPACRPSAIGPDYPPHSSRSSYSISANSSSSKLSTSQ